MKSLTWKCICIPMFTAALFTIAKTGKQSKYPSVQFSQFSRSVVSDPLRPHESQHARPPCPSPTPRVHPNSCALSQWCHPAISSSALSKTSLNIWKFMVHVLLKPGLENFHHDFTSMWDECNYVVVWAFFGIAFLWDWKENWPFPVLWPLLSFPNLLAYWGQHFHSIIFQDLK